MNLEKQIYWLIYEKYQGKITPRALKDIEKLKQGYPLNYLIGWTKFLDVITDLRHKPFIPRPETEYWAEKVLKDMPLNQKLKCLDMFSGSGCLGLAILKNRPKIQMDFAEINSQFIKQIKINLKINHLNRCRSRVIQTNVWRKIQDQYDLILANPPYISFKNKKKIQKEVLKYEPPAAYFSPQNGLYHIKTFLKQLKNHLKIGGRCYLEFGFGQKRIIAKLLKQFGFKKFCFYQDQYQRWRYVVIFNN